MAGRGGGLYNQGTTTLTECVVTGKLDAVNANPESGTYIFGYGGGLYSSGQITLNDCTVSGNSAGQAGGGLYSSGQITLNGDTFSDNLA